MPRITRMGRERFIELWERHKAVPCQIDAKGIYDELQCAYRESHRQYHTLAHVDACLGQFDLAKHLMEDADSVEMAIWFHDLVYQPGASDNEHQSADRFVELAGTCLAAVYVDRVHRLIIATMAGRSPRDRDEEFVVDIDLSSLASPWAKFLGDCESLREEFSRVAGPSFHAAQLAFYQTLLDRPKVFTTRFFRERLEQAAIRNIRRYMGELRAKGSG